MDKRPTISNEEGDGEYGENLDILILGAGSPRGMKSLGPLSNFPLNQETILQRQIRILKSVFPSAQTIFVGGYKAEDVFRATPQGTMVVENELYDDCAIGRSIELGSRISIRKRLLIIYGDLIFDENLFENMPKSGSYIFLKDEGVKEIGVNLGKNSVILFNYSIVSPKWSQIVLLDGEELKIFKNIIENYRDKLGHEILSGIIDKGGVIKGHRPDGFLFEVDTKEDLNKLGKLI